MDHASVGSQRMDAGTVAVVADSVRGHVAGVMHRYAQLNPFARAVSEVAATQFGIRADRQAGAIASRVRQFAAGGQGVLGKVVGHLAKVSPGRLALYGGVVLGGGMLGQQAVATRFSETRLRQEPPGPPFGQTPFGQTPFGQTPFGQTGQGSSPETRPGDEPGDGEVRQT
ncbi:hypothetical protein WBK31_24695 [Nonomuraea sp. N2-4H]|uniref:hypothetical protein n=1 Tax=Nonomuraea sp. N2-4H TaxID=3128898 RepID=UPI0032467493